MSHRPEDVLPGEAHLLALAGLPGMGPSRLSALTAGRDPEWVWRQLVAGREVLDAELARRCRPDARAVQSRWWSAASQVDPARVWERHRRVRVDGVDGAGYPARFLDDPERPAVVVRSGSLPERPTAAIVGTRRCTGYGRDVATRLGHDLADAGVVVVSGLADGIDGAAHRGALATDGAPPVGVVATGLDVVYPARHRELWDRVAARGCLLSEVPLGTGPTRWRFPARNRLIAALADVVVVVESHAGGGSMHTVSSALARDVPVMVVPGPVTSPASDGANALLVDGAAPVRDADDVLTCLELVAGAAPERSVVTATRAVARTDALPIELREVAEAVDATPTSIDAVALRCGVELLDLHRRLRRLEADGVVRSDGPWWWRVGRDGEPSAPGESAPLRST